MLETKTAEKGRDYLFFDPPLRKDRGIKHGGKEKDTFGPQNHKKLKVLGPKNMAAAQNVRSGSSPGPTNDPDL